MVIKITGNKGLLRKIEIVLKKNKLKTNKKNFFKKIKNFETFKFIIKRSNENTLKVLFGE